MTSKMARRTFISSTAALAFIVACTPQVAFAEALVPEAVLSDAAVGSLVSFWDANGVSDRDQAALVEGIENGIVPLSLQPGSARVSVETRRVGIFERTTETFADESIRISDLQVDPGVIANPADISNTDAVGAPPNGVTPLTDIISCSISSGSGYSNADNCLVRGGGGLVTNFFYASYTLVQGANNDQLRNTKNPGQTCIYPYSCSTPSRSQFVEQETTWTNAGATYTGTANTPLTSQTTYLSIEVGEDHATPIWTMP